MEQIPLGNVIPVSIEEEMKKSYIDYAMSVIVGRALPDVRDGLKPVHRRILYSLHELGMTPDKPHRKSAHLVGEVMGKYHPHGDAAIYDALVRMAQSFSTRYPLVDGHGNFGSIDGDPAAAMRYTEVRMSKIATELLADIDKETVDFIPNYDETRKEPVVLPSRIPNLLINGSAGIAVGMATNIPPHNLGEVIDGVITLIDKPGTTIKELMKVIKGPDFPTGGIILGREGIKNAYRTGRGVIKVRAETHIEQLSNNKSQIIVTEIPYQVNKAKMVEKIAELVREKKIEGITDLRDESDRSGLRVVIELRKDVNPQVILNQLYKHTQLQEAFGIIMLALVDGQPRVLNLHQMLYYYLEHQKDVVTRRTKFDLDKAEARAHILEGLKIAISHLDEVIKIIRQSADDESARLALMDKFGLTEKQAQAILDMRLKRLTALEREKLEEEYQELLKTIAYLKSILADEQKLLGIIKKELLEIKKKFNDERRTKISLNDTKIEIEDLIPQEDTVITITHRGYIKRQPVSAYRSQKRGGKGISATTTREEDFVEHLFVTTTHHNLLFFTNKGKVYRLKVYDIPEASRQAKGTAVVNLIALNSNENITAVIPIKDFVPEHFLFMATRQGIVKRTNLLEYDTSRKDGIIALTIDDHDELIGVKLTDGTEEIILATQKGLAIRFSENDVRTMGRTARGVKGISLEKEDVVVSMAAVHDNADLLVVTDKGYGKRTDLTEYRVQSRGGKGILALKLTPRNGELVSVKVVREDDEIMMISSQELLIRIEVKDISKMSRTTQGVMLMRLNPEDRIVAVAKIASKEHDD